MRKISFILMLSFVVAIIGQNFVYAASSSVKTSSTSSAKRRTDYKIAGLIDKGPINVNSHSATVSIDYTVRRDLVPSTKKIEINYAFILYWEKGSDTVDAAYSSPLFGKSFLNNAQIPINNLKPNTKYYYTLCSSNSMVNSFTTLSENSNLEEEKTNEETEVKTNEGTVGQNNQETEHKPNQETNVNPEDLVSANSKFAFDVFKKLNSKESGKNVFISPISISSALSMLYQGAKNDTKTEIANMLNYYGMDINSLNTQYKGLLNKLINVDPKVKLNISNSLWIKDGLKVNSDFINVNKDIFGAEVNNIDFAKSEAADTINKWISNATNGMITKMIEPPIDPSMVMYLINAIYFKGAWQNPFDSSYTKEANFTKDSGEVSKVNMMTQEMMMGYGKGSDYSAIKLPYGGDPENYIDGKVNMYCILPSAGTNVDDFIGSLDNAKFNEIRKSINDNEHLKIFMPKFKMEYRKTLNEDLMALGMKRSFAPEADFSGICENTYVDEVVHKAVVDVNEKGTEAAAVTTIGKVIESEPGKFELNRPFVFAIVDDSTGTILFIGKAADLGLN